MTAPLPTASRWNTYSRSRYPRLWDGCVGAWCPSLGVSGTRLFDFSGRQNWGTLTNMDAATDWVVDDGGYALDFDGVNDTVITSSQFAPGTRPMSACCWVYGYDLSFFSVFLAQRPASFNFATQHCWLMGYGDLTTGATGKTLSVLLYTPSNWRAAKTTGTVSDKLRHVGFSSNGSSIDLYVDGVAAAKTDQSLGNYPDITQQHNTSFGAAQDATLLTQCTMDDIRIYDRALHPKEWRLLARRRAIAYEPEYWAPPFPEQDGGGGITSRPYAYQSARMIGAGR